eukprot:TRINITY_DN27333_c0_g1_i2.p1 TRINITY_DN27333_c0_g1~~TRINITY_DN27333_c0_g1_i2.p1  ORF type:complete len:964 (-),score=157.48 TRINITY_DN27333_c0_g1_i2:47-2938(-)
MSMPQAVGEVDEEEVGEGLHEMLRSVVHLQKQMQTEVAQLVDSQASIADDVQAVRAAVCSARSSVVVRGAALGGLQTCGRTSMRQSKQCRRLSRLSVASDNGFANMKKMEDGYQVAPARRASVQVFDRANSLESCVNDFVNNWPQSLEIRSEYKLISEEHKMSGGDITRAKSGVVFVRSLTDASGFEELVRKTWVFEPDSWHIIAFDFLALLPWVNDVIVLPVMVAWDLPLTRLRFLVSMLATAYWVLAVLLNFAVGFYQDGELVIEVRAIARRYVKTWFVPDLALILLDFVYFFSFEMPKFVRVLTLLRVVRIFRLVQAWNKLESMFSRTHSHGVRILVLAGKILASFILLNHIVGCLLFLWSTTTDSDTGKHWYDSSPWYENVEYNFLDQELSYQYVTAMLYITCMLTLTGAHNIPPSSQEGCVYILTIIFGLMLSGTVVALFSANVVEMAMAEQEKLMVLSTLGSYLDQHNVPPRLAGRLNRQVAARLAILAPLEEKDVPALGMISTKLHKELLRTTRLPQLLSHPLFVFWDEIEAQCSDILCGKVSSCFLSPQDILFEDGEEAAAMYYIDQGKLSYFDNRSRKMFGLEVKAPRTVLKGEWLCEGALWTHWFHVGTLEAVNQSQVLAVAPSVIQETLREHPSLVRRTVKYCMAFKDCLDMACPPHAEYPDDLHIPHCHASDLLSSSSSMTLLRAVAKNPNVSKECLEELQEEIQDNRCALQINNHQLERIVAVVAVRLKRACDDAIWVQVGKWQAKNGLKVECRLPGSKRRRGEAAQKVVQEVLSELKFFDRSAITLGAALQDVVVKEEKYDMRTKYLRTEYAATLDPDFTGPDALVISPDAKQGSYQFSRKSVQPRSTSMDAEIDEHAALDVFVQPTGTGSAVAYAWLSDWQYHHFSSKSGKPELQEMLSNITLDPEAVAESFQTEPVRPDRAYGSLLSDESSESPVLHREWARNLSEL